MRPTHVAIPGRIISTAGHTERDLARLLDLAERHYLAAAEALTPARWATAKSFADGVLWAAAIVARIEPHQADQLLYARCGAPSWHLAGPPPRPPWAGERP